MKHLKLLLLLFITVSASSQVVVKDKIILTSTDSTERYVTGISFPQKETNAANALSLQSGELIYESATGTNALMLNQNPAVLQYVQGMVVNFKTTAVNTGAVTIQLNALPAVPLKKNGSNPIDSLDFGVGQMITAVYDGTNFQVLSKLKRRCPAGFVDVNKDYCIELLERDTVNWFNSVKTCGDLNARLCTMSEWAYACQNAATLNVLGMTDNMEWVDSAANDPDEAKTMGEDILGSLGCNQGVTILWSYNRNFRCCYSK